MKTSFLKSLLAIVCLLCSIGVYAHDFEVDGIYYNVLSSTEVQVSYRGYYYDDYNNEYTGAVVIPASITYNGTTYNVTSINGSAFNGCTGLTSVTIGNSVTSIEYSAFKGCSGLTEVTIPNSVTSIGNSAFEDCTGLTSVTIPNSVTSIGFEAFAYCYGLTGVYITDLSAWCGIDFGNGIANPLYYAHNLYINNELVTNLVIPDDVTSIGDFAFSGCTGLTSVTIGNSVTSIGYGAFRGCTGLTEITIANSVTSIGAYAFYKCTCLKEVNIGNSVTSIGSSAFYKCTGLTEITIPNSVTSIGSSAFEYCTGLTEIVIGNSVTEIGDYAFDKCERIKDIYAYPTLPPIIGIHTFTIYVNDNATLHVPESCKVLYENADYWEYFINVSEDLSYSAVEDITCDNSDAPAEYYDLNGFRIENPTRGIYIVKQGDIVRKVFVNKVQ